MKIDTYPEFFGSAKIYETVKVTMRNYARDVEIDAMIGELIGKCSDSSDFLKKLALLSGRFMNTSKSAKMVLDIREKLAKLIRYSIEPKKVILTRDGKTDLRIMVENLTGAMLKFKVGLKQIDRRDTSFIYNPVTTITNNQQIKGQIIEPGAAKMFRFVLKPDVFSIQDLYELKKESKIEMNLAMQILADGVDGMRTDIEKIPVEISKVKMQ